MRGSDDNNNPTPKMLRITFGIFMILVYLGVGLLFIFNVFDIVNEALSIVIGSLLVLYGLFRGYRLYRGTN